MTKKRDLHIFENVKTELSQNFKPFKNGNEKALFLRNYVRLELVLLILSKNFFVVGKVAICFWQSKVEKKLSARIQTGSESSGQ